MGHELQPVQMPGPTYHKSQMIHPDQIHTSRHCLRISPLRQISGRYNLRQLSWIPNIDSVAKKANQTLGFLKRNIKVHNKDLKSTAYTTLVRPQLEYASTVWSPHTATDITKLEATQRRSAHWATRDYQRTSSVTQMIKDLNWRTLEQRRIDSRLTLMYKITYDLAAIPAADYLIPNTRQSRHNHLLAYRQIPTLKDYYKYTFFPRTIAIFKQL